MGNDIDRKQMAKLYTQKNKDAQKYHCTIITSQKYKKRQVTLLTVGFVLICC